MARKRQGMADPSRLRAQDDDQNIQVVIETLRAVAISTLLTLSSVFSL